MRTTNLAAILAMVCTSSAALAVPIAHCTNAEKTVTASFAYYMNLQSDSVNVDYVELNIDGKTYSSSGQDEGEQDLRARIERKIGFVLFKEGLILVASDFAKTATVYNSNGNTVAKLICGR